MKIEITGEPEELGVFFKSDFPSGMKESIPPEIDRILHLEWHDPESDKDFKLSELNKLDLIFVLALLFNQHEDGNILQHDESFKSAVLNLADIYAGELIPNPEEEEEKNEVYQQLFKKKE